MKMFNKPAASQNRNSKKITVEEQLLEISKAKNSRKPLKDEMRVQKKIQSLQKLQDELLRLDNEQSAKLESIKKAIEDGTYQVSGRDIAEKMINDSIIYPTPRI